VQLLFTDGTKYSIAAYAAIGMDCAENTIPQLFTGHCIVTDLHATILTVHQKKNMKLRIHRID
jgi:hypothetical protein